MVMVCTASRQRRASLISWRQLLFLAALLLCFLSSDQFLVEAASSHDESVEGKARKLWGTVRSKYDGLPEGGKFVTGALIGYAGSRMAVRSAVGVVKVAGAAFVASEVLNAAGVLDDIPKMSQEQMQIVERIKARTLQTASDFRTTVRRQLSPENIERMIEHERMATIGAATGAFAGFVL